MKRHKMTVGVSLAMPDGKPVEEAMKEVQRALSGLTQVGTVGITRITGARSWKRARKPE